MSPLNGGILCSKFLLIELASFMCVCVVCVCVWKRKALTTKIKALKPEVHDWKEQMMDKAKKW